ncbi:MAG TPA: ABC transporter ATP-binding protein [Magnetospirillum sp.]|nr:ABC transporter ATP-binding protein [Magnetospirillum sp.]
MTGGAIVEAEGLAKTYPSGVTALDGVDLRVQPGEAVGILGANGAGKTTLIRILSTLMRPGSGRVRVFGLCGAAHGPRIRARLGVVSQDCTLDHSLTVRRNLGFHGAFHGMPRAAVRRRADELMAWLELGRYADTPIHALSGGTRRKVMLARALLTEPDLLVLDEPTTGLDPDSRAAVWARLRQCRDGGTTLVVSTHHRDEAEALCDRTALMEGGRLRAAAAEDIDRWFAGGGHGD